MIPSQPLPQPEVERVTSDQLFYLLKPLVPMIAAQFGRNCEVVLHDLRNPECSVVAIANGHVSGRTIGSPAIGGPKNDLAPRLLQNPDHVPETLMNYNTVTPDGRRLKSSTAFYRDANGTVAASLCINYDLSALLAVEEAVADLGGFQPRAQPSPASSHEARTDVNEVLARLVQEAITDGGRPVLLMDRNEKVAAVQHMYDRGVFLVKGAIDYVAHALGVSRYTVYTYVEQTKAKSNFQP